MAKKIQIVDNKQGISFNGKYEKLNKADKPKVIAKAPDGKEVKERTIYQGQVLGRGSTTRRFVDDDGNMYSKEELSFWYEDEQVEEISQTKVLEVEEYAPVKDYTDSFVISKYYEIFPSDNGMKKDFDKKRAVKANLAQMYKLWKYLHDNNLVARGEFNISSKGFVASDGYIRPVKFNSVKWGLEIGVFKEEKIFDHLNEGEPTQVQQPQKSTGKKKRLKMV